jgi:hypothetical protein
LSTDGLCASTCPCSRAIGEITDAGDAGDMGRARRFARGTLRAKGIGGGMKGSM